jgi:hypothetical protein
MYCDQISQAVKTVVQGVFIFPCASSTQNGRLQVLEPTLGEHVGLLTRGLHEHVGLLTRG